MSSPVKDIQKIAANIIIFTLLFGAFSPLVNAQQSYTQEIKPNFLDVWSASLESGYIEIISDRKNIERFIIGGIDSKKGTLSITKEESLGNNTGALEFINDDTIAVKPSPVVKTPIFSPKKIVPVVKIKPAVETQQKITKSTVPTNQEKIADYPNLSQKSVTTYTIKNKTIKGIDIANGTITEDKLAFKIPPKIESFSYHSSSTSIIPISENSVTGDKISLIGEQVGDFMYFNGTNWVRGAIGTASQLLSVNAGANGYTWTNALTGSLPNGQILIGDVSNTASPQSLSGDATISNTGVLSLSTGTVTTLKILDGTIALADLASDSVNSSKIVDGSISNTDIANGTIDLTTKVTGILPDANVADNLTISSGTVNATPIGATTASTGAFTTLTSNGNSTIGTGAGTTNSFGTGAGATNTIGSATGTNTINGPTTFNQAATFSGAVTFTSAPSLPLNSAMLYVGNGSNIATAVNLSGDATITNGGVLTIGNLAVTLAKLAADAVNSSKIVDGSVSLADLNTSSVDTVKIVDATITNADVSATAAIVYSKLLLSNSIVLADLTTDSVNSSKIVDGSVSLADMNTDSINSSNILDGTIVAADLATDAVTSAKLLDGTITNADISATAAIALSKLAGGTSGQIIVVNGSGVASYVAVSGDTTIDNAGAITIVANAITNGKLATDAVTSIKILDGTIALADLASDSVNSSKIVDGSISNTDIANGTIDLTTKVTGILPDANVADNLTISSGTVNATPIGATTASTGAFTTLTSNGNSTIGTGAGTTNSFGTGAGATNTIGSATGTNTINGPTTFNQAATFSGAVTFTSAPSLPLNSAMLYVGNGSNIATAVNLSGDATITNGGVLTVANNAITTAKIIADAVTTAKILDGTILNADIAAATIDLTTKVTGILPIANGGTGSVTQNFVDLTTAQTVAGAKTLSNLLTLSSAGTGLSVTNNASVGGTLAVVGDQTNTGDLAVNGGDITTTSTTANLLNTAATTINLGGVATAINIGSSLGSTVTAGGQFTINSGAATNLNLDSGTTGAVNLGTGANAKTITMGNTTGSTGLIFNTGATTTGGGAIINIADNVGSVLNIREGANKYFAVTTTNGSENITLGNVVTNPSYTILGTGTSTYSGGLNVALASVFNAGISMNSTKITDLGFPSAGTDAVNKSYVDAAFASSVLWQAPVATLTNSAAPGAPAVGDRYILQAGHTGFGTCVTNDITSWDGTMWNCTTPTNGTTSFVSGSSQPYNFNGTSWVSISSSVNHTALVGLQGGTAGEYYHLTATQHGNLTSGSAQLAALQTTGSPTFVGMTLSGALKIGDGSAPAPGLAFSADTDTGLYRPGSDSIGFTTGGAEKARLTATGFGIGVTPAYKLDINGDANVASTYAYKYNGNNVITAQTSLNNYYFGNSGNLTGSGGNNTATGYHALLINTTGSQNVAFGVSALSVNTTGFNNAALGYNTLAANTTGTQNIAIGTSALATNTTGTANIAIGTSALGNSTTSIHSIALGYNSSVATTTGSFNTLAGNNSFVTNTTGGSNTGMGYNVLNANTTGSQNVAFGVGSLQSNTTASNNTGLGTSTLSINTTGINNTATGAYGLRSNTTGNYNTANGYQSLYFNTTGYSNTASGFTALTGNTTGIQNSAFGTNALAFNTLGDNNTASGVQAGYDNSTGSKNTYFGYNTGRGITTGSSNTIIGANVTGLAAALANNIIIADGDGNQRINILANGNLGIGTTTPVQKVSITGTNGAALTTGVTADGIMRLTPTGSSLAFDFGAAGGGTPHAWIQPRDSGGYGTNYNLAINPNGGNVGIGTITPNLHGYSNTGGMLTIQNKTGTTLQGVLELANRTDADAQPIGDLAFSASSQTGAASIRTALIRASLSGATANNRGSALQFFTRADGGTNDIAEQMRILSNGNVGIGTASPNAKLEISDTGSSYAQSATLISARSTYGNDFEFGHLNQGGYASTLGHFSSNGSSYLAFNADAGAAVNTYKTRGIPGTVILGDVTNIAAPALVFGRVLGANADNQTITESMRISSTGNIGLGISVPTQQLELSNSFAFPHTTSSTTGVIYKGTDRFLHDFTLAGTSGSNTFMGTNSGNFTMTGSAGSQGSFNTGIGANSLQVNTTGFSNVAVGALALAANTTGSSNVAVGVASLTTNTTGVENVAIGQSSLRFNTTGSENTATGISSLRSNTTGTYNTANGVNSLYSNTTGNYNVASGGNALYTNTTGEQNTATGYAALNANTTGNYNVALGSNALFANTTGFQNTATGYNAMSANTTGSLNSAYGVNALTSNTIGTDNVAMGRQALYANTTGISNTALGSNALFSNTTGSLNTATGFEALYSNTTGANNVASGYQALRGNTTGSRNVATGLAALYTNTTGNDNVASGYGSMYSNTTGVDNIASGTDSLYYNTTGSYNTAIGKSSIRSNTTGSYNTALGNTALYSNTTGTRNTAVGNTALLSNTTGVNNVAVGDSVLYSNTTGLNNTAIGQTALSTNTTGSFNVAVGQSAMLSNTTGSNNIASGFQALYLNTTGDNNTATGYYSLSSNTTGFSNSAYGLESLKNNTTGYQNTAAGRDALYSNTTGDSNNASGFRALYSNTSGIANNVLGIESFYSNTTGGQNTGLGSFSGYDSISGSKNTFLGYNSGRGITTGGSNTIIGANVTGLNAALANNIIIADGDGNQRINIDASGHTTLKRTGINGAGSASILNLTSDGATINDSARLTFSARDSSANNQTYGAIDALIVDPTAGSEDSSLVFYNFNAGVESEVMRLSNTGNVGIGMTSLLNKLGVAGGISFTGELRENSLSNKLIIAAGSGIGTEIHAGDATGIIFKDAGNNEKMRMLANGNIGIGTIVPDVFSRGYTGKIVGISSTGQSALSVNSATGSNAYLDLGVNNTYIGGIQASSSTLEVGTSSVNPLLFSTNGVEKMRILSSGNIGIGTSAPTTSLHVIKSAVTSQNVLNLETSGVNGRPFLNFRAEGSDYGYIGYGSTGADTMHLVNYKNSNLQFGTNSLVRMTIDSSGYLGVGNTNPLQLLDIKGAAASAVYEGFVVRDATSEQVRIGYKSGSPTAGLASTQILNTNLGGGDYETMIAAPSLGGYSNMSFRTSGAGGGSLQEVMKITGETGTVSITNAGVDSTGIPLDVITTATTAARFTNNVGNCTINPTTTSLSCSSDIRLKKNITNMRDNTPFNLNTALNEHNQTVLQKIEGLTPVTYNWNSESNGATKHSGFIAQEVEQLFPDLVATDPVTGLKSVNYMGFAPYVVEAISSITNISDSFKTNLVAWLANVNNGIDTVIANTFKAKNIETKAITINPDDKTKSGITIYDRVTGQPVCMFVANGTTTTEQGVCGEVPSTQTIIPPPAPVPEPTPDPAPEENPEIIPPAADQLPPVPDPIPEPPVTDPAPEITL